MRLVLPSTQPALRAARRLQKGLNRHPPGIKLSKAQGLIAQMIGYRDWQELAAAAGTGDGPYDEDVSALENARRLDRQIDVLKDLGIPYVDAFRIVEALRLTARSGRLPSYEHGLLNVYFENQPEDLDYGELGFNVTDEWLERLSAPSGLVVISGDTGKSVLARATLKEAHARRGRAGTKAVVLDGSPIDFSQLRKGFELAGRGAFVIVTMDDGRHAEALDHLREDIFQAREGFLGWLRIRMRLKEGAAREHRICLYDGYVHPGEAAKHEYAWKWYEPRLVSGYETYPDWVHRWGP